MEDISSTYKFVCLHKVTLPQAHEVVSISDISLGNGIDTKGPNQKLSEIEKVHNLTQKKNSHTNRTVEVDLPERGRRRRKKNTTQSETATLRETGSVI